MIQVQHQFQYDHTTAKHRQRIQDRSYGLRKHWLFDREHHCCISGETLPGLGAAHAERQGRIYDARRRLPDCSVLVLDFGSLVFDG